MIELRVEVSANEDVYITGPVDIDTWRNWHT